jgi:hypothetical protein
MFLVVCSAVAALACRDINRPLDPRGPKPLGQEQQGPPVLLSLTCQMNSNSATITCTSPTASPPPGVSASVIYGATATYAIFFPFNLVKDTVAQTWQFTAYLQNLLKQSIGTLNGTTTTGVKVFVTDFHATTGTGAVSVANADGTGTFTAPNQPYFNYNQIIAPSGYSGDKLWKFNVPKTVTAVSMSILISTDFPAEQNTALTPPATIPDWINADSNVGGVTASSAINMPYRKRVLQIFFQSTPSLADRQLAVAYVNGTVIGGWSAPDGSNAYYVLQVPDDGTGTGVLTAQTALKKLSQVQFALIMEYAAGTSLQPNDSTGYTDWRLNPDSADLSTFKWSLEMVDAPFAWGCSTGSPTTKVGVVDYGFHDDDEMTGNVEDHSSVYALAADTFSHGLNVSSVIAARGNNHMGMTGAMWRATIIAANARQLDSTHTSLSPRPDMYLIGYNIAYVASRGARIVNVSQGIESVDKATQKPRAPGSLSGDDSLATNAFNRLMLGLRAGRNVFHVSNLPLIVVAAGNFQQPGGNATTDAWWAVTPAWQTRCVTPFW